MAFSAANTAIVNRMNVDAQKTALGTEVARIGGLIDVETALSPYQAIILKYNVTADATGGLAITVPYDMYIVDVIVQCRNTVENGTIKLTNGGTDITDTIACATDKALDHAATIDNGQATITTTTVLKAVSSGATVKGLVTIIGYRV